MHRARRLGKYQQDPLITALPLLHPTQSPLDSLKLRTLALAVKNMPANAGDIRDTGLIRG